MLEDLLDFVAQEVVQKEGSETGKSILATSTIHGLNSPYGVVKAKEANWTAIEKAQVRGKKTKIVGREDGKDGLSGAEYDVPADFR